MRSVPSGALAAHVFCGPRYSIAALLIVACLALLASSHGLAQSTDTAASLESLRTQVAEDSSLNEEARGTLLEQIQGIENDRAQAEKYRSTRASLEEKLANSESLIADYRARMQDIENAPASVRSRLGPDPSLAGIEAEISVTQSQRDAWEQERAEALDEMANLVNSEASARERIAQITKARADEVPSGNDSPAGAATEAVSRAAAKARKRLLDAELALLELRLRSAPSLNSIRTARIAWLDAAVAESGALLKELRDAAAEQRQSAAAQRSSEARRLLGQISDSQPELQAAARENLELVSSFEQLATQIEDAQRDVSDTRRLIEEIEQDADLTSRRLNVAGLESKLGEVMLSRLASLPDPAVILARNAQRNQRIADVSIAAIDTEQALRELGDRSVFLERVLGGVENADAEARRNAERLYLQRRELLQENMQAGNTLLSLLVDENQATEDLARVADEYETLLTANLLWVRNYAYVNPARVKAQLQRLLDPRALTRIRNSWQSLLKDPLLVTMTAALLLLVARRRSLRASLAEQLGKPIHPRDESPSLIFQTLVLTLLLALPVPLLLVVLGRAIEVLAATDPVMIGIGRALDWTALLLFGLGFMKRMTARLGVGRRLLKWNSPRTDAATRDLVWFRPAIALSLIAVILGVASSPTDSGGALAAGGSLAMSLTLFMVALRMLRSEQFNSERLQLFCLRAGALISAAIIAMHLSGQLFAAHLYLLALGWSIVAVVSTLLVVNILQRMLLLFRAGLERKAREEIRARETSEEPEDEEEAAQLDRDMDAVSSLSEAYTKLLTLVKMVTLAGLLYMIWGPALPALSIFDSVTLWTTTDASLPAGELRKITLAAVLFAIVTIFLTTFIMRNLPPMINALLMEWTGVSPGSRYAIGMLLQYVILGTGLSSALMMLGFQWEKVQWLVAALGVGIGFGLQEIVANFISGLIVLLEKPIRVGDIINAGGADGTVTRINARATVIETFEGKELMLPNKELITGVVTNWSLSSSKLRLVIPIGIAYGSDVDSAMERLLRIAQANPEVIADPAPVVTFEDFGDNALVLWLRCFALKDYLKTTTSLRQEIYRQFNEAGISISFPQRDVHLDASEPLPIRILSADEAGSQSRGRETKD